MRPTSSSGADGYVSSSSVWGVEAALLTPRAQNIGGCQIFHAAGFYLGKMGPHITLAHRCIGITAGLYSSYSPLVTGVHLPAMLLGFMVGTPSIYTVDQLLFMLRLNCAAALTNYLFENHVSILSGYRLSERTVANVAWMSHCQYPPLAPLLSLC